MFNVNGKDISSEKYYNLCRTHEKIEQSLNSFEFKQADRLYNENSQYIPEDYFIDLKNNYIKKHVKNIIVSIKKNLKSYEFEEADKFYKQNQQYMPYEEFINLKAPYIKKYIENITAEIEQFLKSYQFDQADQFYKANQQYIPEKEYIGLKALYEVKKQIQNYLEVCQFEQADKLYQENRQHITSEFHTNIKNFIKQRIPELFNRNGLLFTSSLLKAQSILPSEEYHPICRKEIQKFFSQAVKSIPINEEQLEAIRELESHVLLRARAGSGKTSVATLKTFFLIEHEKIHPDQIMMLAFNKKAADEISNRIRKQYGIIEYHNARTFHSLAYQLVQPKESLLFDEGDQNVSTQKQSNMIQQLIKDAMNPVFKANLYRFFKQEMQQLENIGDFLSREDYYLYRRNYKYVTLMGDQVKSLGEKYIGDFLFEHGIKHRYENLWFWNKKGNYRPDFSLFVNSEKSDMVIEFWGIDEKDALKSVPEHWTTTWSDYKAEMETKRNFWKEIPQIAFIELSVVDLQHATRQDFEQILAYKLTERGVHLQRLPDEEIMKRLMIIYQTRLTRMFLQFIQKAKKQRLSPDALIPEINAIDKTRERVRIFSETANAVYRRYITELQKTNSIDYDDLMERAISIVHETKGICSIRTLNDRRVKLTDLKYLLIDEYQDFSLLFYQLVDAIRQYNPNLKLFCVGDDWQAINAFAGSNLQFFNDFNDYISPSEHKKLLTNFRSSSDLVDLANRFMDGKGEKSLAHLGQTGQIFKCFTDEVFIEQRPQMKNTSEQHFDQRFMTYITKNGTQKQVDVVFAVGRILKVCHSIITNPENKGKTIGIVSRNRAISYYYDTLSKLKQKLKETCKGYYDVYHSFDKDIRIMTTHGFKGLEADIIIMINVNNGQYPTIHPDNELYEIFGETPADILAEEERLFYVGITRAKTALYILCDKDNESEYLKLFNLSEYKARYYYDINQNIMCSSPQYLNPRWGTPQASTVQYLKPQYPTSQYHQNETRELSKSEALAAFYGRRPR